jgi:diguanylate cyclase (GGDEF)-like protein
LAIDVVSCPARLVLLLLLYFSGIGFACAGESLEFRLVGTGVATDNPTQLADPAPATAAMSTIRDLGGGTWWRGEILADVNGPQFAGMPTVLHFSGGFHATDTVVLPGGQRFVRNRFGDAGPAWGLRAEVPILLPSSLGAGAVFHVHIDDRRGRSIQPQLSPLSDYLDRAVARKVVVAASTTALLTLALLAVILRRSFGGEAYGHLAWMAFLMAGYILIFTGELHNLVNNAWLTGWSSPLQRTFAILAVAFSHLFIVSFLELRRRRPRVARVFSVFVGLQVALVLISWIEGREPSPVGALASNLLILASIPLVLFEAWRAHRDRLQSGRYVLWAWGPALLVLSLWIFTLQGWLSPTWIDVGNLVFCSMALQVAVLLLGLADDTARLRRERDVATDQAGHDPLTGVLNRRALEQRLQSLLADAGRKGEPLSLVFLDLDHFKRVNDRFGHAAGDQCLCELVGRARLAMRENDVLARYGGEEFVIVLPGKNSVEAADWADRLRRDIAASPFPAGAQAIPVNASLGICEWSPGGNIDALFEHADQALYRAKQGGRNRVVQWQPDGPELA